ARVDRADLGSVTDRCAFTRESAERVAGHAMPPSPIPRLRSRAVKGRVLVHYALVTNDSSAKRRRGGVSGRGRQGGRYAWLQGRLIHRSIGLWTSGLCSGGRAFMRGMQVVFGVELSTPTSATWLGLKTDIICGSACASVQQARPATRLDDPGRAHRPS